MNDQQDLICPNPSSSDEGLFRVWGRAKKQGAWNSILRENQVKAGTPNPSPKGEGSAGAQKYLQDQKRAKRGSPPTGGAGRGSLTYKERKEMEALEAEIAKLEQEKSELETALCSGTLSVAELTEKSKRLPVLQEELDEKEMRWLELSELES